MLTDEERQEIQEEASHYLRPQAAAVDAMKILQRHRGWVSEEALQDVGDLLQMTKAELDSVATFYNLIFRKQVGRHVIMICNSVSCWIMGYPGLRQHLTQRLSIDLGQTTADGRFTLLPIVCLGDCDHAPTMMVDNQLYRDLTPEKIDEILASHQ